MALTYEIVPDAPPGTLRAVDPERGIDRIVFDRRKAEELGQGAPAPAPAAPMPEAPSGPVIPVPNSTGDAARVPSTPAMPPPVSDTAAQAWGAAQEPAPAPIVRASGAPPPPPAAPAGTVLTKAKVEPGQPGYTYDKAAEEQRGEALLDQTVELQRRADATDVVRREQEIELQRQREDAQRREAEQAAKATRYERELEQVVKRDVSARAIEENRGFFGSILGLVGQTLGYLSTPDSGFGRLQTALERRTERELAMQREDKESAINRLTKQLGSAQQAENHYRAQAYATTADILETKLQRLGVADQFADRIQALRDGAMAYNEAAKAASFGKAGQATYEFERPKPTGTGAAAPKLNNAMTQRLEKIGLTPEKWTKGLDGKVVAGQNSETIAQAADTTRMIDADINLLESIAAANGGKLPQKGTINIPDFLVPKLSQMGFESGMQAEQVGQLLNGYVNRQARSYGGAITDSDRNSAELEVGTSTEGLRFYLNRLRDKNNRAIRTALSQQFPGAGNEVFSLLLEDSSANEGVPQAAPIPFEKKNAPPVSSGTNGAKPPEKTQGRSLESMTGLDERDAEERKRKAKIQAEADRTARRQRLERFLQ